MSNKINHLALLLIFALTSPSAALDLTGGLDISGQYNTNFIETGLYEEAQTLLTGEANSLAQIKFNLATEHNFSEKNHSKLDYTFETKSYSRTVNLNYSDHTIGLQFDQRLTQETALEIKASAKRHYEENTIKKHLESIFLVKGSKKINPNLNLEISLSCDRKNMENTEARDYFAYMGYSQTSLGASFRYKFRKDLVSKLRINSGIKKYEHAASNYLKTVFSTLNQAYREDQSALVDLDFTRVFHEDFLANLLLGYVDNPSNISYYQYAGTSLAVAAFGYWRGNRWHMKYALGNYDYPSRSGTSFSGEKLQSNQYSISLRREMKSDVYLNLSWEGIRNSSNNPTNNFNNDSYTFGLLASL